MHLSCRQCKVGRRGILHLPTLPLGSSAHSPPCSEPSFSAVHSPHISDWPSARIRRIKNVTQMWRLSRYVNRVYSYHRTALSMIYAKIYPTRRGLSFHGHRCFVITFGTDKVPRYPSPALKPQPSFPPFLSPAPLLLPPLPSSRLPLLPSLLACVRFVAVKVRQGCAWLLVTCMFACS